MRPSRVDSETRADVSALSLTKVAEKGALSRQMVSYVERGLRIPSIDTLLRITRVLGIDAADVTTEAQHGYGMK
ncbi:MAG: helix-turn-helix transcriptional regulator [Candidatus Eremiobacteraeota bacterium]|nr:helix-turn-helix transcriptional regulator [Candidatus Eremiobacteraeota bacterium]